MSPTTSRSCSARPEGYGSITSRRSSRDRDPCRNRRPSLPALPEGDQADERIGGRPYSAADHDRQWLSETPEARPEGQSLP